MTPKERFQELLSIIEQKYDNLMKPEEKEVCHAVVVYADVLSADKKLEQMMQNNLKLSNAVDDNVREIYSYIKSRQK